MPSSLMKMLSDVANESIARLSSRPVTRSDRRAATAERKTPERDDEEQRERNQLGFDQVLLDLLPDLLKCRADSTSGHAVDPREFLTEMLGRLLRVGIVVIERGDIHRRPIGGQERLAPFGPDYHLRDIGVGLQDMPHRSNDTTVVCFHHSDDARLGTLAGGALDRLSRPDARGPRIHERVVAVAQQARNGRSPDADECEAGDGDDEYAPRAGVGEVCKRSEHHGSLF